MPGAMLRQQQGVFGVAGTLELSTRADGRANGARIAFLCRRSGPGTQTSASVARKCADSEPASISFEGEGGCHLSPVHLFLLLLLLFLFR
eukprot:108361-Pyramimonas_sp.AAC.1